MVSPPLPIIAPAATDGTSVLKWKVVAVSPEEREREREKDLISKSFAHKSGLCIVTAIIVLFTLVSNDDDDDKTCECVSFSCLVKIQ
jgi:hypothetical protein